MRNLSTRSLRPGTEESKRDELLYRNNRRSLLRVPTGSTNRSIKGRQKMNIRDYLRQYKEADRRVRQLEQEYKEELDQIDAIGSPMDTDGTPHGTNIGRPTEQQALLLIRKAERLQQAKYEAIEIRQEIYETIRKVPGAEGSVLYERYILLKRWDAVADSVGYSVRQVSRIHQSALRMLEDVLECRI